MGYILYFTFIIIIVVIIIIVKWWIRAFMFLLAIYWSESCLLPPYWSFISSCSTCRHCLRTVLCHSFAFITLQFLHPGPTKACCMHCLFTACMCELHSL